MVAQALAVALVAVVVGDGRHLALTQDGRSWRESSPPHIGWIDDAMFIDARHGWVVSDDCVRAKGAVARTADGGRTWRSVPFTSHSCRAGARFLLDFVDARHGWIVDFREGASTRLWGTRDGGRSWRMLVNSLQGAGPVVFRTPRSGWLGGGDGLYRSVAGGRRWRRLPFFGRGYGFSAPTFFGREGVTAAVIDTSAAAFRSADGGGHWQRTLFVRLPTGPCLFNPVSLSTPRSGVNWLVVNGRRPLLYVSRDGGRSWNRRLRLPVLAGTLAAIDARTAVLPVYRTRRWVVLVTHDGGRTWRPR
jgi:photosystem II stability/assembly factor-like uncharacterized protein